MTQEEIIRMAREVWGERAILPFNELERFAALVREQAYREDKSLTLGFEVTERKFVDLTDDEIFKLGKEKKFPDTDPVYFARAIIAAYKEKNK